MATWVEGATASVLSVRLSRDGDFIVPDPLSNVTLTIRAKSGALLHIETQVASGSDYVFNIPALVNALTSPNFVESRLSYVVYTVNGGAYRLNLSYQVSQFVPFTINEDSVRTYLGITLDELEDYEIDLLEAYYSLVDIYGSSFTTPFNQEGNASFKANKAVALQAALNLAVSLPQRIAQKTDAEKASFQRATKFDPYKLVQRLEEELSEALAAILPSAQTTVGAALFAVSGGVDPFTGT